MPPHPIDLPLSALAALSNCLNHMLSETGSSEFQTVVGISKDEAQELLKLLLAAQSSTNTASQDTSGQGKPN